LVTPYWTIPKVELPTGSTARLLATPRVRQSSVAAYVHYMAIRVVLADDSVLVLERLMAVLARADEIEVAATAGTAVPRSTRSRRTRPTG